MKSLFAQLSHKTQPEVVELNLYACPVCGNYVDGGINGNCHSGWQSFGNIEIRRDLGVITKHVKYGYDEKTPGHACKKCCDELGPDLQWAYLYYLTYTKYTDLDVSNNVITLKKLAIYLNRWQMSINDLIIELNRSEYKL